MKVYVISLGAGLLVGVVYSLLHVRSPAPPIIALIGLLGILAGEQVIPISKKILAGSSFHVAWQAAGSQKHLFGRLPGRHDAVAPASAPAAAPAAAAATSKEA
jgi:XapX domain-containing protein